MKISIETKIHAPINLVWTSWTTPEDITKWNFAIDEWCCPAARIDLKNGGKFCYRMEAKDKSIGFDFEGVFTEITANKLIKFSLGDDREVIIDFIPEGTSIIVRETFEAEDENSAEQQRQGWLSILNNFKKHVESKCN